MKPTLKGFIDFVNAQPDERPINQNSFSTCACGDYMSHCGLPRADGELFYLNELFEPDPPFRTGARISLCSNYAEAKLVVAKYE